MKIQNTCSIVTGGALGIGREVARQLVQRGGKVIIADIKDEEGIKLVAELNSNQKNAAFVHCDVSKREHLEACFQVATNEFRGAQIVFNNAGRSEVPKTIDSIDKTNEFINVIFTSVVNGCILAREHFAKQLEQDPQREFCIINTSSYSAHTPALFMPIYSLCKRSVMNLTQIFSQLHWKNTRINAIGPSFTETEIFGKYTEMKAKILKKTKFLEASDVAKEMIRLVEDDGLNGVVRFMTTEGTSDAPKLKSLI